MYGLVNQAIKELIVSKLGEPIWESIAKEAGAPNDFVSLQYYEDKLTYRLVGAASKALGAEGSDVLNEFGKHWVLYTAKEGYGSVMDLFGHDFKSCLMNLNHLHARMGMTMPDLTPPQFEFTELAPDHYRLDYFSQRQGLSHMVVGLLTGLAARHGVEIETKIAEPAVKNANQSFFVTVKKRAM